MTAFATGLSQAQVLAAIQGKLINLRNALSDIEELYGWTSELAQADMEAAAGLDASDASTALSAVADANALAQIFGTGQAPSTYPQVTGTPYVYASSVRMVIGPQ